jgi:CRP/FNR family transcriptional activator FtrB
MRPEDELEACRLPILTGLTPERRGTLLKGAYLQRFPAHVDLITEGQAADFLHVILEGQVEVFANYRDRETTLAVLGPPENFILAAVILDRPHLKSARSLSPSRILMLPAANVREVFAADAEFARWVARDLATTYRDMVKDINNYKLRSGIERLANWLLCRDEVAGSHGHFELPYDKKKLAAKLGLAPEALSRIFANLGDYGVVVDGRDVRFTDRASLERLAKPSPLIDDPSL